MQLYKGCGCPNCFGTGYRGRIAVFEILTLNRRLRAAISRGADQEELLQITQEDKSFVTMEDNCRRLVLDGTTTADEVRRIVSLANLE